MEVNITYSKRQLEMTVDFIAKNNNHFYGQRDYIRDTILEYMKEVALNPNQWMRGTMGFTLIGDRENEDLVSDTNTIYFEILVNADLGNYSDADTDIQVWNIDNEEY